MASGVSGIRCNQIVAHAGWPGLSCNPSVALHKPSELPDPMLLTRLPNESTDYAAQREALRLAEIELMRQREHVAGLRRALPLGPAVDDYVFLEGPRDLDAGDTPVRQTR